MDDELNLRLLGMMLQSSYLMQTREKYRGQGRLLILLYLHGALTQRELCLHQYNDTSYEIE